MDIDLLENVYCFFVRFWVCGRGMERGQGRFFSDYFLHPIMFVLPYMIFQQFRLVFQSAVLVSSELGFFSQFISSNNNNWSNTYSLQSWSPSSIAPSPPPPGQQCELSPRLLCDTKIIIQALPLPHQHGSHHQTQVFSTRHSVHSGNLNAVLSLPTMENFLKKFR